MRERKRENEREGQRERTNPTSLILGGVGWAPCAAVAGEVGLLFRSSPRWLCSLCGASRTRGAAGRQSQWPVGWPLGCGGGVPADGPAPRSSPSVGWSGALDGPTWTVCGCVAAALSALTQGRGARNRSPPCSCCGSVARRRHCTVAALEAASSHQGHNPQGGLCSMWGCEFPLRAR